MGPYATLIPDPRMCCSDLAGEDAYIGATITHPNPDDGTAHELDVYWRHTPPGRRTAALTTLDPLTVDGTLTCPCGWSGQVVDGAVT